MNSLDNQRTRWDSRTATSRRTGEGWIRDDLRRMLAGAYLKCRHTLQQETQCLCLRPISIYVQYANTTHHELPVWGWGAVHKGSLCVGHLPVHALQCSTGSVLHYRNVPPPKRSCGRQAGRETPNAVVLDEIAEHETTGQGEPSRAGHCAPGNSLPILEGKSSKKCYIDVKTTKKGFGHCKT